MTKKEYKARKLAWQQALADGRVVRYVDSLTSYPTVAMRDVAIAKAAQGGIVGEIVKAS